MERSTVTQCRVLDARPDWQQAPPLLSEMPEIQAMFEFASILDLEIDPQKTTGRFLDWSANDLESPNKEAVFSQTIEPATTQHVQKPAANKPLR